MHVTNSSQGFLGTRTTKRERSLKVADGRKAKVEAIGSLPLVLHGGFTLILNNVLYIPSLQKKTYSLYLCWKMMDLKVYLRTISAQLNLIIKLWVLLLAKTCCTSCL
jgi:hypothetical protein